nr:hypothetical protein [Maliibacterium massiliense]
MAQVMFKRDEIRDTSPQSLYMLNNMFRNLFYVVFGNIDLGNLSEATRTEIQRKISDTQLGALIVENRDAVRDALGEVGAVNLLKNSAFATADAYGWEAPAPTIVADAQGATDHYALLDQPLRQQVALNAGDYVLSLQLRGARAGASVLVTLQDGANGAVKTLATFSQLTDVWQRKHVAWHQNQAVSGVLAVQAEAGSAAIHVSELMLEAGQLPSAWKPYQGELFNANAQVNDVDAHFQKLRVGAGARPLMSLADADYYVCDAAHGGTAAGSGTGSWTNGCTSIQTVLDRLPHLLEHTITIHVYPGIFYDETVRVQGLGGSGSIVFQGASQARPYVRQMQIRQCGVQVSLQQMGIGGMASAAQGAGLLVERCACVLADGCHFVGADDYTSAAADAIDVRCSALHAVACVFRKWRAPLCAGLLAHCFFQGNAGGDILQRARAEAGATLHCGVLAGKLFAVSAGGMQVTQDAAVIGPQDGYTTDASADPVPAVRA